MNPSSIASVISPLPVAASSPVYSPRASPDVSKPASPVVRATRFAAVVECCTASCCASFTLDAMAGSCRAIFTAAVSAVFTPAFSSVRIVATSTARPTAPVIHLVSPRVAMSTAVMMPPLTSPSWRACDRSSGVNVLSAAASINLDPVSSATFPRNIPAIPPTTVPTPGITLPAAAPAAPPARMAPVLGNCPASMWSDPDGCARNDVPRDAPVSSSPRSGFAAFLAAMSS